MEVKVKELIKRIYGEIERLFKDVRNVLDISFCIIENQVFLFENFNNGNMIKKIDLNIEYSNISYVYLELYNFLKECFIKMRGKYINIYQTTDLKDLDNPYLLLTIKDHHQNLINVVFKNIYKEKEVIDSIKDDWIELLNIELNSHKSKN